MHNRRKRKFDGAGVVIFEIALLVLAVGALFAKLYGGLP